MIERVQEQIDRLKHSNESGIGRVATLESVSFELLLIVDKLYNDNPNLWHGTHTGVHHTKRNHISELRSKSKTHQAEAYRLGFAQTLSDLEEIIFRLNREK